MGTKKQSGFSWLIILLIIIILAGGGFAGYKVYKSHSKSKKPAASQSASTQNTTKATAPVSAVKEPTAAELENIKASITSGNTAALEGYMASSVNVVIAASEGMGAKTPVDAINSLSYVNPGGTNTWDFALPASTLNAYQTGFYKQYFPTNAVVGKSSDGHVISFQFDNDAKIDGVFMAVTDAL